MRAAGNQILAVHCGVANEARIAAPAEATGDAFRGLDLAYNNAGVQALSMNWFRGERRARARL